MTTRTASDIPAASLDLRDRAAPSGRTAASVIGGDPARPSVGARHKVDVHDDPHTGHLDLGVPLTERLLRRLPGPRWVLIVLWAGSALLTPVVLLGGRLLSGHTTDQAGVVELLAPPAVLAYVVAILLWGAARLVRDAAALQPEVERLTRDGPLTVPGTGRWDVAGPVLFAAAIALVALSSVWSMSGPVAGLIVGVLTAVSVLPVATFVWTYVRLLIGLDRLGGARLELEPFPQDRTLGLGAVGSLAFSGFALLVAAGVPIMLVSTQDGNAFLIALAILGVSVPLVFLSMWRLHRQMSSAKSRYVGEARALYSAAYEPLRRDPNLAVLDAQAAVLDAARALEERAQRIQVWPIDDGLIAMTGFIVAGVASGIVVRFIISAAHL